jgi:hypothetical protein
MIDRKKRRKKASLESSLSRPTIVVSTAEIETWIEKTARKVVERASSTDEWNLSGRLRDREDITREYINDEIDKISQRLDQIECFSVLIIEGGSGYSHRSIFMEMSVSEFLNFISVELKERVDRILYEEIGEPDINDYDDYGYDEDEGDDDDLL